MSRQVDNDRLGACVNVLKKVRTNGGWKLCPVVREANGRLRDRVRVNGRTEVHSEGVYYLEWREAGRRLREAVPNHAEVLERARLKSLELEARRAGAALGSWQLSGCTLAVTLEPCLMCAGALVLARVERLVFGAWDPKAGAAGSVWDVVRDRRVNHRVEVVGGVREAECAALLAAFFATRR